MIKVYGVLSDCGLFKGKRLIACCRSQKEFVELLNGWIKKQGQGYSVGLSFVQNYCCCTGNLEEIKWAMTNPRKILVSPFNEGKKVEGVN